MDKYANRLGAKPVNQKRNQGNLPQIITQNTHAQLYTHYIYIQIIDKYTIIEYTHLGRS